MYKLFLKRFFDCFLSVLGIILSSPIWFLTIIAILINDFGPIFHKSERVGKNDKQFKMLKFRSMKISNEDDESSLRPEQNRIFFVGKIIRKLKIDELPQLINVLKGDMAIVGPRPVAKNQIDIFRKGIDDVLTKIRPGLTGPAALYDSIYGEQFCDGDIEEYKEKVLPTRIKLELVYAHKMGFLFDLRVFFDTAWCVICCLFNIKPKRLLKRLVSLADEKNE